MSRCFGLALGLIFVFGLGVVAQTGDQADAHKLLDKAIAAHGGKDNLAKFQASRTKMKGKFYGMGEAIDYTGELAYQLPDKYASKSILKSWACP